MTVIAAKNDTQINEAITCENMMVIGPNGEKMGLKSRKDALTLASYAGLDLVLMSGGENPVCKIIDYNKYHYEKQKQQKEQLKKQREANLDIKEYRLSVTIDVHDFETKLRNAKNYLEKGHKIKVSVRFKGRQMAHPELGKEVIIKFVDKLSEVGTMDSNPKMEGRSMSTLIVPKK